MSELLIVKPSQILRETRQQQCKIGFSDGNRLCAFSVLMYKLGWNGDDNNRQSFWKSVEQLIGMNAGCIFAMNTKHSFSEIADWLEEKGL